MLLFADSLVYSSAFRDYFATSLEHVWKLSTFAGPTVTWKKVRNLDFKMTPSPYTFSFFPVKKMTPVNAHTQR